MKLSQLLEELGCDFDNDDDTLNLDYDVVIEAGEVNDDGFITAQGVNFDHENSQVVIKT